MDLQKVMREAVLGALHGSSQRAFQPHLSVGQVRGKSEMLRLVSELQAAWQPVRLVVPGVELIWRSLAA